MKNQNKRIIVFGSFIILILVLFWLNFSWKPWPKTNLPGDTEKNSVTGAPEKLPNYVNEKLKFSLMIPDGFKTEENGEFSILITPDKEIEGQGPTNFIYVSVVPPDKKSLVGEIYNYNDKNYQSLIKLAVGESVSLADKNQPKLNQWFTYKRVEDIKIDSETAMVFENNKPWEFPAGTTETRAVFSKNDTIYLLGFYTGGESTTNNIDPQVAKSIIESFLVKDSQTR